MLRKKRFRTARMRKAQAKTKLGTRKGSRSIKQNDAVEHQDGDQRVMPRFAFARRFDLGREAGLTLAGNLTVDILKTRKTHSLMKTSCSPTPSASCLTPSRRASSQNDSRVIFGWPGGHGPDHMSMLKDTTALGAWMAERVTVDIRMRPRSLDLMRPLRRNSSSRL